MCLQPRTPIMLACTSLIVACSLAVTLLSLPEVLQRALWARQVWMLVGLQVVPLGVSSILIGLAPAAFVTKPLTEIDRAVRRYACDETDAIIPTYHSDQIGALGWNLNALMRPLAKKQARAKAVVELREPC
jgi:hypothetical protein